MAQGMALVQDLDQDLDLGVARSWAWQGLTAWPVPPLQLPGTFPAAKKNTRQFLLSGIFCPGKGQDVSYGTLIAAQWGYMSGSS